MSRPRPSHVMAEPQTPSAPNSALQPRRYFVYALCGLLVLVIAGGLFARYAGHLLTRDDPLPNGQSLAVLLMGKLSERGDHAAALLKQGSLAKLIFFQTAKSPLELAGLARNEAQLAARYLDAKGIGNDLYELVDQPSVASTRDEAVAMRAWVEAQENPPRRLVVITSWYHTRRAAWIFEKVFAGSGLQILVSAAYGAWPQVDEWWKTEDAFLAVFNEYLKWAYYLVQYRDTKRWVMPNLARNAAHKAPT